MLAQVAPIQLAPLKQVALLDAQHVRLEHTVEKAQLLPQHALQMLIVHLVQHFLQIALSVSTWTPQAKLPHPIASHVHLTVCVQVAMIPSLALLASQ